MPPIPSGDPITGANDEHCDRFVALGDELGLTRDQMVVICGTLFANHAIATGVQLEQGHQLVEGFWAWRQRRPVNERALVKAETPAPPAWLVVGARVRFKNPAIAQDLYTVVSVGRLKFTIRDQSGDEATIPMLVAGQFILVEDA